MPATSSQATAWLDARTIENALAWPAPADALSNILARATDLAPLSLAEIAALALVEDPVERKRIAQAADAVKQKVYGDRIALTAPLHLDNHCASGCLYCSAHAGNTHIIRARLDAAQVAEAGLKLIRQGHKRVILTSGQTGDGDADWLCECAKILSRLSDGPGEIRRINVCAGAFEPDQCEKLAMADIGALLIYQETYHEESYAKAHPSGPKSDYKKRLAAPGVALDSCVKDIGLGLCLGLGPWRFDLLALYLHASWLASQHGLGCRNVNLHRCRPAPGCDWQPPYPLSDADFLHCVAVTRLAIPHVGLILTTKEPSGLWKDACDAGASQLLTGSLANPYDDWLNGSNEKTPFPTEQATNLDEVVRFLLEDGRHLPTFCAACPRLGREGQEFIEMAISGDLHGLCEPNSLASFLEYLLNYATPYTRELGEKAILAKLDRLSGHARGAAERLLTLARAGRMDEFI